MNVTLVQCKVHKCNEGKNLFIMEIYRFRLQKYVPNNKVNCPGCGRRRCATKYIDTLGEIIFPDEICLCDHANSCGYHYPPKEYFHDNPEVLKELMEKEKCSDTSINSVIGSSLKCVPPAVEDAGNTESRTVSYVDSSLAEDYGCI